MTTPARLSIRVEVSDDWTRGDLNRPEGVMLGFVTLKIAGSVILDHQPVALNPSAVALLRTLNGTHRATTAERENTATWPLFFCFGSLWNRCGCVYDFTVEHDGDEAVFCGFLRCKVDPHTVLRTPWRSWVAAVERFGSLVLRRSPIMKSGVRPRYQKRYTVLRNELKALLARARHETRHLTARPTVTAHSAGASRPHKPTRASK